MSSPLLVHNPDSSNGYKAYLEFQLPKDERDMILAIEAPKWKLHCWDWEQQLRQWRKYGGMPDAEQVERLWHEAMQNNKLDTSD